jgi:RNA polymerase sigma-70 factor (ECF subfamily)
MADGREDSALVAATLAGDQHAFGDLVARYRDAVFGVAFHRTGSFEPARDAVQETFIKAYRRLATLRDATRFAHWLYRIADTVALNMTRQPRREVPLESVREQPTRDPVLAGLAKQDGLARWLRRALASLTEPTRLAVILHYVNGYSHAEIAQFLGTTPGAVRTRVSRARSQLREEALAMVEETFEKTEAGFRWVVVHESGKARSAMNVAGESVTTSKEEARELANASLWFEEALKDEPGFAAMRRQGAERWVRYVLEECVRHEFATAVVKGPALNPQAGRKVTELCFPDPEADPEWDRGLNIGWALEENAWQPIREALAVRFGVSLPKRNAAVQGTGRLTYQDQEHVFRARFLASAVHIARGTPA